MRANHEELLLRNSALAASAFWHLSRSFTEFSRGRAPELPYFLVGAGMIFHRATIEKVYRMQYDSGLLKALSERPDMIAGLQGRMEANSELALKALQLGTAVGILQREGGDGFPTFRAEGYDLPTKIRNTQGSVPNIFSGAKRLGAWFSSEPIEVLFRQLNIEL